MFGWGSCGTQQPWDEKTQVELLVHMDSERCEKRVRRAISKIQGVESLNIDMEKQKVTVTGFIDQENVLKAVRRKRMRAELWSFPYESDNYLYAYTYLDEATNSPIYNYNEGVHGYSPDQTRDTVDDHTVSMFSDDNVHACNIM